MIVNCNGELRGIEKKVGKETGKEYYILRCEDEMGKPFELLSDELFYEKGLQKGDQCTFTCDLYIGKTFAKLTVLDVVK